MSGQLNKKNLVNIKRISVRHSFQLVSESLQEVYSLFVEYNLISMMCQKEETACILVES